MRRWVKNGLIILFWLLVWQLLSAVVQRAVQNQILLVGPVPALQALWMQIRTAAFWQAVLHSFAQIGLGFLSAFFLGVLFGWLSFRHSLLEEVLAPLVTLMKAVPVVSFVILALIWVGARRLSILVSFLIVFPTLYTNTIAGFRSTDVKLVEMAQVFRVRHNRQMWEIYRPAAMPYLQSGCKTALGMSWKAGITAELIAVPTGTIGEQLYLAKIYLDTAELFAWTFMVVLLSILFEKLFLAALRQLGR